MLCVYTEVMAQNDTVTFLIFSKVDQSYLRIHEAPLYSKRESSNNIKNNLTRTK